MTIMQGYILWKILWWRKMKMQGKKLKREKGKRRKWGMGLVEMHNTYPCDNVNHFIGRVGPYHCSRFPLKFAARRIFLGARSFFFFFSFSFVSLLPSSWLLSVSPSLFITSSSLYKYCVPKKS